MSALWVVPHKGDAIVGECVTAIRAHHPSARVATYSADHNPHYAPGAFQRSVIEHPNVEFFYLIFDSLIINANLDWVQNNDLTTVRWIDSARHGWGWNDDTGEPLGDWATARGVIIPPRFPGVFGPMLMAHRSVIERANLFRILPTNRFEQCALERAWGIWLADAGYDVTEHSLQGEHLGHFDTYDETYVTKRELHRA